MTFTDWRVDDLAFVVQKHHVELSAKLTTPGGALSVNRVFDRQDWSLSGADLMFALRQARDAEATVKAGVVARLIGLAG